MVSLLLAGSPTVLAQAEEKAARELVEKALAAVQRDPTNGRDEAERFVRDALEILRTAPAVSRERFAEASVMLALLMLGDRRPAESFRPHVQEAIRIYESAVPQVVDGRMALALEVLSASPDTSTAEAQDLRKRSAAIRQRLVAALRARDAAGDLPASNDVRRFGARVSRPKLLQKQEPVYSEEGRLARREGSAKLSIVIDTDGKPKNVTLVHSLGFGLDEAAYQAVKTWRFEPASADGEPVAVPANVEVNFRLL